MKKLLSLLLVLTVVLGCFGLTGCEGDVSVEKERSYQETLMQQANDKVGNPEITEFYEKKLAKEIFEKRDDSKLICYAYTQSMNGKFVYVGKCMGYGLPYSTQYTNPATVKDFDVHGGWESATVPQADPNGLYGATGLSATWVMMIDEVTGENYIMYCEPNTIVTEHKVPARIVEPWSLPSDY